MDSIDQEKILRIRQIATECAMKKVIERLKGVLEMAKDSSIVDWYLLVDVMWEYDSSRPVQQSDLWWEMNPRAGASDSQRRGMEKLFCRQVAAEEARLMLLLSYLNPGEYLRDDPDDESWKTDHQRTIANIKRFLKDTNAQLLELEEVLQI